MKKFCELLKEHAMKIVNRNQMKMQNYVIFLKKIENRYLKCEKYRKVRDNCHYTREYRGPAHSICNLRYSVPKQIPVVFHNESNYYYHFIIKQ